VRGKDEGAYLGSASFQWSPALKVLMAYLLRCAAAGRRCPQGTDPILSGERSSPAASLNFAMSKKPNWIKDMFGEDAQSHPFLLDLIRRSNPDLKYAGPVILRLDTQVLPPQRIFVFVGDRPVDSDKEMDQIANAIATSFKPRRTTKARIELTITGDLEIDWSPDLRRAIEKRLAALKIKNSQIIAARKGSIKLLLELPSEEAERLFWAVHSGELDDLGVIDGEYAPLASVASDVDSRHFGWMSATKSSVAEVVRLERYRDYLKALASTRLNSPGRASVDASDIVQEALLKAHKAREQFRGHTEQELAAWLRAILNNTLANALRSYDRGKPSTFADLSQSSDSSVDPALLASTDSSVGPEATAQRNEQLLHLARALEQLPDDQRGVVELKHLHGLSIAEICDRTGRSKAAVVGLLYRGVKALRAMLNEPGNPGTAGAH
jgi:RNA polymerase sigma-70 factor (ECF subfamily)